MQYIDKLKEYAENRSSKISEKQQYLGDLQEQLKAKQDEVKKLENEYKQSFDDKVFDKLLQSKKDADAIQDNVNKISGIIKLMDEGNFQYDAATLEKEIDEYISNLGLEKLKDEISKAKDSYINALNTFENALDDIAGVKTSIGQYTQFTDRKTRQSIINYLTKHSKDFYVEDDQVINKIKHENLLRSIRSKGPSIYVDNYFAKGDE